MVLLVRNEKPSVEIWTEIGTSYGLILVKLGKYAATLPGLQFAVICFSVRWTCIYVFCWLGEPEADTSCSKQDAFPLFSFRYQWCSGFLIYLSLRVILLFPSPNRVTRLHFLNSGFCCSMGFWSRVAFIGQVQSSPILGPLWLQRKELLVLLWSKTVFLVLQGTEAQYSAGPCGGFVIAALKEDALPFLLGTACCFLSFATARSQCPSPSKVLLFLSVGNVSWSILCWGKGHW